MTELLIHIAIILVFYFIGMEQGYNYAKDIALGKRRVKRSKDFMEQYRKEIGWK